MKKIGANSHFQLVCDNNLEKYGNRIIQIDTENPQENMQLESLYVCEIDDDITEGNEVD